jgi:hypothetical protein
MRTPTKRNHSLTDIHRNEKSGRIHNFIARPFLLHITSKRHSAAKFRNDV